jgi:3D (Asp-Asp-Asp) domain-containing protein
MGDKLFRTMEKIIILFLFALIILIIKNYIFLPNHTFDKPITNKSEYYHMTTTAYTRHPECISPKYDDGYTATGTKVKKGVVAINVDLVNGKWIVNSILKLGQKIYITSIKDEPIGYFRVEDTGPFKVTNVRGANKKDLKWDRLNCDIYVDNINIARNWGCKPVKVYVID